MTERPCAFASWCAISLTRPGGTIVFCTCSLEPEEGPEQIAQFLATHAGFERAPVAAEGLGIAAESVTRQGELRTLPFHADGMDGFYVAGLRRLR